MRRNDFHECSDLVFEFQSAVDHVVRRRQHILEHLNICDAGAAEIEFHNGSRIINIANNQSSKGAHVQRGIMDEDNLTDEDTYLDVLEPIFTTVKRKTIGKECVVDPMENNGSI